MSGSFVGKIQQFVANVAPWFVLGPNIGRFLEATALTYDDAVETLAQGLRLTQPLRCDESALPFLSKDRGIRIYETEPTDSKRRRLANWLPLHRQFGTHQGELRNLQPYFLPAKPLMRIVHQDGAGGRATWWTLNPDDSITLQTKTPSNWNFDGATAQWSRWWCIIYKEAAMGYPDAALWDGGASWDDGTLWDGGPSSAQIDDIVAALSQEAKGLHSKLWGVIMTTDAASFDPTATAAVLGDGSTSLPIGNWGSPIDPVTGYPSRPPYASFLYNLGQG